MPIAVKCRCCGQAYRLPDEAAGRTIKCKKCTLPVEVPATGAIAAQPMRPVAPIAAPPPSSATRPVAPVAAPAAPPSSEAPIGFAEGHAPEPRKPTTIKKKKKSKTLAFVLLGLAAAFFFCFFLPAAVGVAWYVLSNSSSDGMKYMPNNTSMIMSMRVADTMKSDFYQQVMKELPDASKKYDEMKQQMQQEANMTMEDIDQILMGGDVTSKEWIVVVTTKKKITIDDVTNSGANKNKKYKKTQVGKYTMYEDEAQAAAVDAVMGAPVGGPGAPMTQALASQAFCLVDSKMIVGGPSKTLKSVLERDKKPELSEGMKTTLKYTDFKKASSLAVYIKGMKQTNMPPLPGVGAQLDNIEGAALNVDIKTDILVDATVICKDDKSAEELRKMADGGISVAKAQFGAMMGSDAVQVLDSLKLANKANLITATMEIKTAQIVKAAKSMPNMGGPPLGGPQPDGQPFGPPQPRPRRR
jgi:hypothetical protein